MRRRQSWRATAMAIATRRRRRSRRFGGGGACGRGGGGGDGDGDGVDGDGKVDGRGGPRCDSTRCVASRAAHTARAGAARRLPPAAVGSEAGNGDCCADSMCRPVASERSELAPPRKQARTNPPRTVAPPSTARGWSRGFGAGHLPKNRIQNRYTDLLAVALRKCLVM